MTNPVQNIILSLIRLYQLTLSPDHGWFREQHPYGWCRFYPSCSQYAYESVEKYGTGRGVGLALLRIAKCNPWHKGGFDLVK